MAEGNRRKSSADQNGGGGNETRNIFVSVKEERRTRGITKCSLRTVNEWNRLSADCVGASSVNIFKNKIDIYLRRAGFT